MEYRRHAEGAILQIHYGFGRNGPNLRAAVESSYQGPLLSPARLCDSPFVVQGQSAKVGAELLLPFAFHMCTLIPCDSSASERRRDQIR